MNTKTLNQLTSKLNPTNRSPLGRGFLLLILALAGLALLPTARAQDIAISQPDITISQLAGPWQAALIWSGSGCGPQTGLVNFTLDPSGTTNSAVIVGHTQGCGNSTLTGQTFTISSLNANGSGTASLSCGPGCGWGFNIQVMKAVNNRQVPQIFNLVDVNPANPGNFVEGTAIRQQ